MANSNLPLLKGTKNIGHADLSIVRLCICSCLVLTAVLALVHVAESNSNSEEIDLIQGVKSSLDTIHRSKLIGKGLGGTLIVAEGFRKIDSSNVRKSADQHQHLMPVSAFPSRQQTATQIQQDILLKNAESLSKVS
jgi:hypothetical protein